MAIALTKLLIGAGISVAAVGSGGYGIYYFATAPKTIRQKFFQEGLKLLDLSESNTDSSEWTKKITEYKKTSSSNSKFADLDLTTTPNEDEERIKKLKEKCGSILDTSLSSSDTDLLHKVKLWCFKDTLKMN